MALRAAQHIVAPQLRDPSAVQLAGGPKSGSYGALYDDTTIISLSLHPTAVSLGQLTYVILNDAYVC